MEPAIIPYVDQHTGPRRNGLGCQLALFLALVAILVIGLVVVAAFLTADR